MAYTTAAKESRQSGMSSVSWHQLLAALAGPFLALFILAAAADAEIRAMLALSQQQAQADVQGFVLTAVIFLVIVAAGGPALAYLRVIYTEPGFTTKQPAAKPSGEQHHDADDGP